METNPIAYSTIGALSVRKMLGVVIMDYAGEKLCYRVVKSNFVKRSVEAKTKYGG